MPGIVGIISQKPAEECESRVKAMVACLEHETFYTSGMHSIPKMGTYMGWVADEASLAAGQPFLNEQRNIILFFAGECFVDLETRAKSRQRAHDGGDNQTSWLIALYEAEGDRFFERLNGLFSGLLIDRRQDKAFLFNDRYGVERVYWHETGDGFYFASEAKALLHVLPDLRAFDEKGVAQFLTYGCTLDGRTLFRGIQLLPGGSLWSFEGGKRQKRTYFSLKSWESQPALSQDVFQSKFEQTFKEILPRYFQTQARLGISLTGGLDTRMIMACLPDTAQRPICYTFSGESGQTMDDQIAARVAAACNLEHRLLRIGPDFFSDFASHADRTVYLTDGCLGVMGAHEVYLNRQARRLATVRLTGLFGSEILRGVSTLKPISLCPLLISPELRRSINSSTNEFTADRPHPVGSAAFRNVPWNLFGNFAAARSQVIVRTPYLDNEIVALAFQAPEALRRSPQAALRLVENNNQRLRDIPTDRRIEDKNAGLCSGLRRLFLEASFRLDYIHNEGMPHWLSPFDSLFTNFASRLGTLRFHKYLHYRSWFRRNFAGYINDVITDARLQRMAFWNPKFIKHLASDHIRGRKNYVLEINAVLTLEAIERLLFRNTPRYGGYSDDLGFGTSRQLPSKAGSVPAYK